MKQSVEMQFDESPVREFKEKRDLSILSKDGSVMKDSEMKVDFLQQFTEQSQQSQLPPRVSEIFGQLTQYLDNLNSKLYEVKEKNQADFQLAFRNHMGKVRRELQQLKQKSEEQERSQKQNDRLSIMEKELSWFREESLNLYKKLESRNRENSQQKFELEEVKKERSLLEGQVKQLLKKNRLLEVQLFQKDAQLQQQQEQMDQINKVRNSNKENSADQDFYTHPANYSRIKSKIKYLIRPHSLQKSPKRSSQQYDAINSIIIDNYKDKDQLLQQLTLYVNSIIQNKETQIRNMNMRIQGLLKQSKAQLYNMENFYS